MKTFLRSFIFFVTLSGLVILISDQTNASHLSSSTIEKESAIDLFLETAAVNGSEETTTPGDRIEVTWTIKNSGNSASSVTQTAIYLSQNDGSGGIVPLPPADAPILPVNDSNTSGKGDIGSEVGGVLLHQGETKSLLVEESETFTLELTIPINIADGEWYLLFAADMMTEIEESNESNNVVALPLSLSGGTEIRSTPPLVHLSFEGLAEGLVPFDAYAAQGVEISNVEAFIAEDFGGSGNFCSFHSGSATAGYVPIIPAARPIINVPSGFSSISMIYAQSPETIGGFTVWSGPNGTGNQVYTYLNFPDPSNGTYTACSYDVWFGTGTINVNGQSIEFFELPDPPNDPDDNDPTKSWFLFDDIVLSVNEVEIVVHEDPIAPREGESAGFTFGITLDTPVPSGQSVDITLERVTSSGNGEDLSVLGSDTVTFTSSNWSIPQPLTIWAPENDADNHNQTVTFRLYKSGGSSVLPVAEQQLLVTELDDDFGLDVAVSQQGGGGISVQPAVSGVFLDIDDYDWWNIEFTALPNEGFQFTEWTTAITADGPIPVPADGLITLTGGGSANPGAIDQLGLNSEGSTGFVITAFFSDIPSVPVTMQHSGNGSTTVNGQTIGHNQTIDIPLDQDIPLSATPAPGWFFTGWSSNPPGIIANPGATATTLNTNEAATITANFSPVQYNLTILNDGNGTTTPGGTQILNAGEGITVTVQPNSTFRFLDWAINSGNVDIDPVEGFPFDFTVTPNSDAVITAHFELGAPRLVIYATNLDNPQEVIELRGPESGIVQELLLIKEEGGPPNQYKLEFFNEGELPLTVETVTLTNRDNLSAPPPVFSGFCLRETSVIDFDTCPIQQDVSTEPLPSPGGTYSPTLYLDFGSQPGFPDVPEPSEDHYAASLATLDSSGNLQLVFDIEGSVEGSTDVSNVEVKHIDPEPDVLIDNPGELDIGTVDDGSTREINFEICNNDTTNSFFIDITNVRNQRNSGINIDPTLFGFFFDYVPPDVSPDSCQPFSLYLDTANHEPGAEDVLYEATIELGTNDNLYVFDIAATADSTSIFVVGSHSGLFAPVTNGSQYPIILEASNGGLLLTFRVSALPSTAIMRIEDIVVETIAPDENIFTLRTDPGDLPGTLLPGDTGRFHVLFSGQPRPSHYRGRVTFHYREVPDGATKTFTFSLEGMIDSGFLAVTKGGGGPFLANSETFDLPVIVPGSGTSQEFWIWHVGIAGSPSLVGNIDPNVGPGFSVANGSFSIPPGGMHTFRIDFTNATAGTYEGIVQINSNDPVLDTFMIELQGNVGFIPEIRVEQAATADQYPDGSTFTFPDTPVDNLPTSRLFNICNDGIGDLIIDNPDSLVSGTGFLQVGNPPTSSVVAGSCTSFRVRFHVATPDTYSGAITIENNDPNEDPYDIFLEGTALPSNPPEIRVVQTATGDAYPDGSTFTFPDTLVDNLPTSRLFDICNDGTGDLTINNLTTLVSGSGFLQLSDPVSPVAAGTCTSFRVRFHVANPDSYSGAITIENNDPDEDPYNIFLEGTALASIPDPDPPEIRVEQAATGDEYPEGSTFTFPDTPVDDLPTSRLFNICNDGTGDLIIDNPSTLVNGLGFLQLSDPVFPVSSATCTSFRVRFHVANPGSYSGAITIENNDPDEDPYNIFLEGIALPSNPPEIRVEQAATGDEYPNGSTFTFPDTPVSGLPISRLFNICNDGTGDLIIDNPDTLVNGSGFLQIGAPPSSLVPQGTCTSFRVRFHVANSGYFTGIIAIQNNDPDENPYEIVLEGTATN